MPRSLDECLAQMDRSAAFHREWTGDMSTVQFPYMGPLLDAVALFDDLGIGYALIGGIAAMHYGRRRPTEDVDFVAVTGHMDVLFSNGEAMRRYRFDPSCTWKLYHTSGVDIDVWKDEFSDEIIGRAILIPSGGRDLRIIEKHDLIAMKLRAGRIQDDYDISEMIRAGGVDETVLATLVTPEQMQQFAAIRARVR